MIIPRRPVSFSPVHPVGLSTAASIESTSPSPATLAAAQSKADVFRRAASPPVRLRSPVVLSAEIRKPADLPLARLSQLQHPAEPLERRQPEATRLRGLSAW